MIFPMIVGKLTAGVTALILANILSPKLLAKIHTTEDQKPEQKGQESEKKETTLVH